MIKQKTQVKILPTKTLEASRPVRKLMLSSLVVVTFAAYAIRERLVNPDSFSTLSANRAAAANPADTTANSDTNANSESATPAQPAVSNAPGASGGAYRDGEYVGNVTDAFYGPVQVKAIIQGGKIADAQFLDYPHDRRTSQFINSQAMPYLQREAVQAQNAQVDIISGATLTSEAFIQSLQTALDKAKG